MKRISFEKRSLALALLVEGNTINGICRMLKIGKPNLLRFFNEVGEACKAWHDEHFQNLSVERLEIDEQWSYCHTHKERIKKGQSKTGKGDAWLWAAIAEEEKAIISWTVRVKDRDWPTTWEVISDTAERIDGRVHITTDGWKAYQSTIKGAYGERATHAVEIKNFNNYVDPVTAMKVATDRLAGTTREAVHGNPDLSQSTTSHIERYFLTVRQGNKRFARKTLAYSKKGVNHALTMNIQIFMYNMCRKHETIKDAPAVKLGVISERWSAEDVVRMAEKYHEEKTEAAFEKAFEEMEWSAPERTPRSYDPQEPKTPWYLDPESGGPNPPKDQRKEGVLYDDERVT